MLSQRRRGTASMERKIPGVAAPCGMLLVAGAALLVGVSSASARPTAVISASKDNTLYESPTGALSNGAGNSLFAGRIASGEIRRGLLAFDIASSIPAGSTITGVELTLHMTRSIAGFANVGVHRTLANWGEGASDAPGEEGAGGAAAPGDATWLHSFSPTTLWTTPGGDFSPLASAVTEIGDIGVYVWGSTAAMIGDVQLWVNNPSQNYGWTLVGDESSAFTSKRFASLNNLDPSVRPTLSVTYVPAPSSAAVAILATVVALRRRR